MRLEQAIFTSVRRPRLDGYQLAAASAGVSAAVSQELTVWGPAHDSLWDTRRDARSVNFHPLASGDYCLSWTTLAGEEYSARSGGRVYTQMFLLPRDLLARFAFDPFLVLRALSAAGRLIVHDTVPTELPTVPLLGQITRSSAALLPQVLEEVDQHVFDQLVHAVQEHESVAVVTSGDVERLFQAILQACPASDRPSISFTTGLKPSARRPFSLFVLPNDPALIRQSQRHGGTKIIDLTGEDVRSSGPSPSLSR